MFRLQTPEGEIRFAFLHYPEATTSVKGKSIHGWTLCTLWSPEKDTGVSGMALCSAEDRFDRDAGRKIALARALQKSGLNKARRAQVWDRYFLRSYTNRQYAECRA